MFQHQGDIRGKSGNVAEVCLVVEAAAPRDHFRDVGALGPDIFRVAGQDVPAHLPETLVNDLGVVVGGVGALNDVADIHVGTERLPVDSLDQLQVGIGGVGQRPSHHL